MEKMLFTSQRPEVTVTVLPDGKRDVTVLTGEEVVVQEGDPERNSTKTMMFQYNGNNLRTVYEVTEEEVLADLEKYLNYDPSGEPTMEQIQRDSALVNAAIDNYTLELIEGGLI